MTEQVVALTLRIETDSEADADELAVLAVDLRELLLELDIESADHLTRGQAPPGTRAGEMVVAGALTVMLARSKELVGKLVETVQWWVSRVPGRSVKLELDGDRLEVTGLTLEDQRKLIQLWAAGVHRCRGTPLGHLLDQRDSSRRHGQAPPERTGAMRPLS